MTVSTVSFTYDSLDRCIASTRSGEPVGRFFYKNDQLVTAIQGTVATCLFRNNHQAVAQRDSTGTYLLTTDLPGSAMSFSKHMHPVHYVFYTPYGYSRSFDSAGAWVGFNGEQPEALTGHYLVGNGQRVYNPVLMRFNTPDSLSPFLKGGINAYAYCSGDPVNWKDPTGHIRLPIKSLSGFGGAVLSAPSESRNLWKETLDVARTSLTRSASTPESIAPGRQALNEGLEVMPRNQTFTNLLYETNKNLISNADSSLSVPHASFYLDTAQKVEAGALSNSSAHFSSAYHWLSKTNGASRPVGTAFNFLAGFMAAGIDHKLQKTGGAIRQLRSEIRT